MRATFKACECSKAGKMLPKELKPLQIRIEEAITRVARGSE
jgi:hypothetical protein